LLISRPGHLFPREEIVERVWHQKYLATSRSLDVHVRRLRAKLDEIGSAAELHTVRGVGYRLEVSAQRPKSKPGAS
jgi:DNA-binding response OmpR family regulator